jgi:MFS transporter, DHA1 family, inner membrane transport protein
MPRLLTLFALVNLVIGSSAFVMTGILQLIAQSLGITVAAAGQAITAYALSTAVLAPLLLIATGRWQRKRALLLALALFTLGNALCAVAADLPTLLAGRVLLGLGAMATPLMASLAIGLVEPARRGQALALVFLGMSLSYVVGVPLGASLGYAYGWHVPLAGAALVSGLTLAVVWALVPATLEAPGASLDGIGRLFGRGATLSVFGLTLVYFTAIFCVFSYIGPVLQTLRPMSPGELSGLLAAFGVAGVVGTVLGGRASDRYGPRRTLAAALGALAATMAVLPLTAGHGGAMLVVMLVWGMAGFAMMAPQQERLARLAGAQTPLALSINASMLYLGLAAGAAIGGVAAVQIGFVYLPWVSAPIALLGWLLLVLTPEPTPQAALAP